MAMKTAFCYVSLRTGSLIAGWLTLGLVLYNALATCLLIISPSHMEEDAISHGSMEENPISLNITEMMYNFNITGDGEKTEDWPEASPLDDRTTHYYVFYAHTILNIVVLICLLYGTYKSRPGFLIPYLIDYTIIILLLVFVTVYSLVRGDHVAHLVFKLIAIPVGIYFLCIVGSHFLELRSDMQISTSHV